MTSIQDAYLDAARSAHRLLQDPAVPPAWDQPSALAEFSVGGLAAHLAHQVMSVPGVLAAAVPAGPPVPLPEHYERVTWRGADPLAEANVGIRTHADQLALEGAGALADRVATTIEELAAVLPTESADRAVATPSGPWALRLDDFLTTRMMEIAVHSDDLAVSVGIEAAALPDAVIEPVLGLLTALAVRRHGQAALLRALTRAERAPALINAL
jgi:Mycothiol maleylpyruvate isomerase N-terminal domain